MCAFPLWRYDVGRPTTKPDLLKAAADGFAQLNSCIDHMPPTVLMAEYAFEDRDRNARDVLWHLHAWHEMVIEWHRVGTLQGGTPAVPGEGYTWKTLPALNLEIWKDAQAITFTDARAALEDSHVRVVRLIESHANDELFGRNVYAWTKSATLGAYFVSSTSSHYNWALTKLRKHKRLSTV